MSGPGFQLSNDIEHYLAALSKVYARDGERLKEEIIVNSRVRIHEEWTYDNWNGGMYGHALYLTLPESLYLNVFEDKERHENEIKNEINKIHNVQNEFVARVFLEMEKVQDRDWRRESGVLQSQNRVISPTATQRIWGDKGYRIFLSHKTEVKKESAHIKERLAVFGISSFVAHTDIHPTKEWQDEIENALASMDAFVALLTEKFHESYWTDQEVGYALGRGVPLIAVRIGRDPYGFIGRFQALTCDWDDAPWALVKLLIKQSRMLDSYISAVSQCPSFENGNALSQVLPYLDTLTGEQADKLVSAYRANPQIRGSYGFDGRWPSKFGPGLASHLRRVTGKPYVATSSGEIELRER